MTEQEWLEAQLARVEAELAALRTRRQRLAEEVQPHPPRPPHRRRRTDPRPAARPGEGPPGPAG